MNAGHEITRYRTVSGIGGRKRSSHLPGEALAFADDHLLKATRHQYKEQYKRFHFRDITAVIVVDRPQGALKILLGVSCLPVMALIWWMAAGGSFLAIPDVAGIVVFAVLLVVVVVTGLAVIETSPNCRTMIRTATSSEELPSVRRWSHARRFIAELAPLVRAAQEAQPVRDTSTTTPP